MIEHLQTNGGAVVGEVMPSEAVSKQDALLRCETDFKRGFRDQVIALARIKAEELYREVGFGHFLDYCRERLDIGRSQAYNLLDAAETIQALIHKSPPLVDSITSERITRPLNGMKLGSKVRVLATAVRLAERKNVPLTGALVADVARKNEKWKPRKEYLAEKKAERVPDSDRERRAFIAKFNKLADGICELGAPEALVDKYGSALQWEWFEQLYDWLQRAREVS